MRSQTRCLCTRVCLATIVIAQKLLTVADISWLTRMHSYSGSASPRPGERRRATLIVYVMASVVKQQLNKPALCSATIAMLVATGSCSILHKSTNNQEEVLDDLETAYRESLSRKSYDDLCWVSEHFENLWFEIEFNVFSCWRLCFTTSKLDL